MDVCLFYPLNLGPGIGKRPKWLFVGKIAEQTDKLTNVYNFYPMGTRKRGRPRIRWEDETIKHTGKNWHIRARDDTEWTMLGETFIQQWIDTSPI